MSKQDDLFEAICTCPFCGGITVTHTKSELRGCLVKISTTLLEVPMGGETTLGKSRLVKVLPTKKEEEL